VDRIHEVWGVSRFAWYEPLKRVMPCASDNQDSARDSVPESAGRSRLIYRADEFWRMTGMGNANTALRDHEEGAFSIFRECEKV